MAIIRISDVFVKAGIEIPNSPIVTDKLFKTTCDNCGESQLLSQCNVSEDNNETIYKCKNGCQTLLIVGKPGGATFEGRGYRLKDYVVRNASDLFMISPNTDALMIPKSPHALD